MASFRRVGGRAEPDARIAPAIRFDVAHRNAQRIHGRLARIATAALLEPYSDDPKNSGIPRYEADKLDDMTKERVLAGFQIGFHAIGDKGIQMALDAFAGAEKAAREAHVKAPNGGDDFRLRVEHAQVTTPSEIARFKELKVIASMQPSHLITDMRWANDRLARSAPPPLMRGSHFSIKGCRWRLARITPSNP